MGQGRGLRLAGVDDPLDASELEDMVGLSLSGGGFKAAMFHLGALVRINEMGALRDIDRISSVSGGSIAAGVLASAWSKLEFDEATGVAINFADAVFEPLVHFCRKAEVDVAAWFEGVAAPGRRASDEVAEAYAKWLVGPSSTPWCASLARRALARSGASARARHGSFLGLSADPFSGCISPAPEPAALPRKRSRQPAFQRTPGGRRRGIYDNLGVEPIWKRCRTLLVSNAGDPFAELTDPPDDWMRQLRRTVSMVHRQAENNRMRFLIALSKTGQRKVALWNLRGEASPPWLATPKEEADLARRVPVRLKRLRAKEANALLRHGSAMANAAIGSFWLPEKPPASAFPGWLQV